MEALPHRRAEKAGVLVFGVNTCQSLQTLGEACGHEDKYIPIRGGDFPVCNVSILLLEDHEKGGQRLSVSNKSLFYFDPNLTKIGPGIY